MLFENLYQKNMYFKHDLFFSKKNSVLLAKRKMAKKKIFFMVEKAKQKIFWKIPYERKNTVVLRAYFCWGRVFPGLLAMSLVSYQYILTILLINGNHSQFAMRNKFKCFRKDRRLFRFVP